MTGQENRCKGKDLWCKIRELLCHDLWQCCLLHYTYTSNRPFGPVSSGSSHCGCPLSVVFRTSPSHLHCIPTIPKLDADGVIANLLTTKFTSLAQFGDIDNSVKNWSWVFSEASQWFVFGSFLQIQWREWGGGGSRTHFTQVYSVSAKFYEIIPHLVPLFGLVAGDLCNNYTTSLDSTLIFHTVIMFCYMAAIRLAALSHFSVCWVLKISLNTNTD